MRTAIFAATCLMLAGCIPSSKTTIDADTKHYQLAVDNDGNAWRLDTKSGQMEKCWQGNPLMNNAQCMEATQPAAQP